MTATTITKIGKNYFLVKGVIAVIAERIANEPFATLYRRKWQAELAAKQNDATNQEALAHLAEVKAYRLKVVQEYLAARAARPASTQMDLFA